MECRAVVNSLSDFLDGWVSDTEFRLIEEHLSDCNNCRSARLELAEIRTAARDLPLHTPPRALWFRVANIVEAELPKSERPTRIEATDKGWWGRIKSRKFTVSLPQMAGAGALALASLIFGVFSISQPTRTSMSLTDIQSSLLPDEDRIKADLDRKVQSINARKANWDPQVREDFDQELKKIEAALSQCRQGLQANPHDRVQQHMVRALYNEKRQLLEDVERLKW